MAVREDVRGILDVRSFWENQDKMAIYCKTEEQVLKLKDALKEYNITWKSNTSIEQNEAKDICLTNDGIFGWETWLSGYIVFPFEALEDFIV